MLIFFVFRAIVWVILNATGTVQLTNTGIPYPLYAFSGTLIWSIIIESINTPMLSLKGARNIISKINFPKEALVLSGIYKMLFNTGIKMLLLIFFLFYFKVLPSIAIFYFPVILFGVIIFGITIGLFLTPFGVLYNDVSKIISIVLKFLMYATPVVYIIPSEGIMKTIMELNPITPLVIISRNVLVGLPLEYIPQFLLTVGLSLPLFCLGLIFYRISVPILVERTAG